MKGAALILACVLAMSGMAMARDLLHNSCPMGDWKCQKCVASAKNAAMGLAKECFQCYDKSQDSACLNCMSSSENPEIIKRCLEVVPTRWGQGMEVVQWCAQPAFTVKTFNSCINCISDKDTVNHWGCSSCIKAASEDHVNKVWKAELCLHECMQLGLGDGWGCSQCLNAKFTSRHAVRNCFKCYKQHKDVYKCVH